MYRKLRAVSGPLQGNEYVLDNKTTIGRSGALEVQLLGKSVSREHARLELLDNGKTLLRDLDSRNGTFVNGQRITDVTLESGQVFEIGNSAFVFEELDGNPPSDEELPMLAVLGGRAEEVTSMFQRPELPVDDAPTVYPGAPEEDVGCQDPLHLAAKANGWKFCPVCGGKP